jgi:hypothetical protein
MSFDLNRIPYAADSEKEPPTTEVRKKCLFYMCFYPFVREIKIDNEVYHKIFSYIYTTDGRYFLGYYRPEPGYDGIDGDFATDPDILYCCCCIFCCCRSRLKSLGLN